MKRVGRVILATIEISLGIGAAVMMWILTATLTEDLTLSAILMTILAVVILTIEIKEVISGEGMEG